MASVAWGDWKFTPFVRAKFVSQSAKALHQLKVIWGSPISRL